jgi:hypothetical protein
LDNSLPLFSTASLSGKKFELVIRPVRKMVAAIAAREVHVGLS